jgi:hypothetical protein
MLIPDCEKKSDIESRASVTRSIFSRSIAFTIELEIG